MRAVVAVVAALSLLVAAAAVADARSSRRPARPAGKPSQARPHHGKTGPAKRVVAVRDGDARERGRPRGQSIGTPWDGQLAGATRLRLADGAHIRRPYRAFGTRTTVELVRRAITETLDLFPGAHVFAVGDLSAQHGGPISDHQSHQSGRDADLGLFYKRKPAGYPTSFVRATEDTLDCAATFTLLSKLLRSAGRDGGVQLVFLDYDLQAVLYHWALDHDVSERRLERMFQYPYGRGAGTGLIRHEPNHDNHIHVRFRCSSEDPDCR